MFKVSPTRVLIERHGVVRNPPVHPGHDGEVGLAFGNYMCPVDQTKKYAFGGTIAHRSTSEHPGDCSKTSPQSRRRLQEGNCIVPLDLRRWVRFPWRS